MDKTNNQEKECPECGQRLRIPDHIGGLKMVCPSCGATFGSDFKFVGTKKRTVGGLAMKIFEAPTSLISFIGRLFTK